MTKEQLQAMLDAIRAVAYDGEHAHALEDDMREAVLRAIADGTAWDAREAAALALTSSSMDFDRHCA